MSGVNREVLEFVPNNKYTIPFKRRIKYDLPLTVTCIWQTSASVEIGPFEFHHPMNLFYFR